VILGTLPSDVANDIASLAMDAAWYAANTRVGYNSDAAADLAAFNSYVQATQS
jgi:hypothetical protein